MANMVLLVPLAILVVLLGVGVVMLLGQLRATEVRVEARVRPEFERALRDEIDLAHRQAQVELERWKSDATEAIRQDAITRSQGVTLGKVTEHLTPFLTNWPYNPREARFLGSPIDLLVFDGMEDGEEVEVIFVEVKTGSSQLSARQKAVRDAILAGRVRWEEFRA